MLIQFRFHQVAGDSSKPEELADDDKFVPCSDEDEGAIEISLENMDPDRLECPKVTKEDVVNAIKRSKSTIDPEVEEKMQEYTRDFGPL